MPDRANKEVNKNEWRHTQTQGRGLRGEQVLVLRLTSTHTFFVFVLYPTTLA